VSTQKENELAPLPEGEEVENEAPNEESDLQPVVKEGRYAH